MLEENLDYQLPVKNNTNIASLGIYKFISERKGKREESKKMQVSYFCVKNVIYAKIPFTETVIISYTFHTNYTDFFLKLNDHDLIAD